MVFYRAGRESFSRIQTVAESKGRIFRSTELRGFPFFRVVYNKPGLSTTDCYGSRDELRLALAKQSVKVNLRVTHCLIAE
jgi:hypothetical protein